MNYVNRCRSNKNSQVDDVAPIDLIAFDILPLLLITCYLLLSPIAIGFALGWTVILEF